MHTAADLERPSGEGYRYELVKTVGAPDFAFVACERLPGPLQGSMVWVIAPCQQTITTFRVGRPPQTLGADETLDGEDVLPGLLVPVARLFPPQRN